MAVVTLTTANTLWLRIERVMIMLLGAAYIANAPRKLADMIGIIKLIPPETHSSATSLVFACDVGQQRSDLLYWELDRDGPCARGSEVESVHKMRVGIRRLRSVLSLFR